MYGVMLTETNELRVRDGQQFIDAMEDDPVEVQGYGDTFTLYGLQRGDDRPGLWPSSPDSQARDEMCFYKHVAHHLAGDSVAMSYTYDLDPEASTTEGYAVAINSAGRSRRVDIRDIVTAAGTLGTFTDSA